MVKRSLLILILLIPLLILASAGQSSAAAPSRNVVIINLNEQIDPGSAAMIQDTLSSLSPSSTAAVVIVMNTPGGLLSDMLTIINSINQTEGQGGHGIPVYTYVPPNGMAASAGSYIAMACDQIYMGPGSFIGPSTPIVTGGAPGEQAHVQGAMEALMISMAQAHGRNSTSAIAAVTSMVVNNTAYSAIDASNVGIINGMSTNLTDFMTAVNLSQYPQVSVSPSLYDNFLSLLSNSFIDGLLITIGTLAILLDFYHGTAVLSVVGIAAIALGALGLEIVGAQSVGIFFIILGAIVMMIEFKTGHGIALVSGVILALIGAFLLSPDYISSGPQNPSSPVNPVNTGNVVIAIMVVAISIFVAFYLVQIIKGFRRKKFTGIESMVGLPATVTKDLNPSGSVSVEGQQWQARSEDSSEIKAGEKVEIVAYQGLLLIVRKLTGSK